MAVASYHQGPHKIGPKVFPAPKTASLRAWYRAARKVIPDLPEWRENYGVAAHVDVELIHFDLSVNDQPKDLYIARKKGSL